MTKKWHEDRRQILKGVTGLIGVGLVYPFSRAMKIGRLAELDEVGIDKDVPAHKEGEAVGDKKERAVSKLMQEYQIADREKARELLDSVLNKRSLFATAGMAAGFSALHGLHKALPKTKTDVSGAIMELGAVFFTALGYSYTSLAVGSQVSNKGIYLMLVEDYGLTDNNARRFHDDYTNGVALSTATYTTTSALGRIIADVVGDHSPEREENEPEMA